MKIEGDLSVDTEREVIVDDAERQSIPHVASSRAELFGRSIRILLHQQLPTIQHDRVSVAHARQNLRYRLVRVALFQVQMQNEWNY